MLVFMLSLLSCDIASQCYVTFYQQCLHIIFINNYTLTRTISLPKVFSFLLKSFCFIISSACSYSWELSLTLILACGVRACVCVMQVCCMYCVCVLGVLCVCVGCTVCLHVCVS